MGMFDKIVNVFVEEVPEQGRPSAPGMPPPSRGAAVQSPSQMLRGGAPPQQAPARAASAPARTAAIDEKVYKEFSDSLNRALEAGNLPGFDFFEFHQLFKRFKASGKNEQDALQTALTSAETMRVDRNTLIANYQHYVNVLNEQKRAFEGELKTFFDENIKGPKEEQTQIDNAVKDKEVQIKQLQNDIAALQEKKKNMGVNAEKAEKQTLEVQAAFARAFQEVSNDLKSIVDKLKSI